MMIVRVLKDKNYITLIILHLGVDLRIPKREIFLVK